MYIPAYILALVLICIHRCSYSNLFLPILSFHNLCTDVLHWFFQASSVCILLPATCNMSGIILQQNRDSSAKSIWFQSVVLQSWWFLYIANGCTLRRVSGTKISDFFTYSALLCKIFTNCCTVELLKLKRTSLPSRKMTAVYLF